MFMFCPVFSCVVYSYMPLYITFMCVVVYRVTRSILSRMMAKLVNVLLVRVSCYVKKVSILLCLVVDCCKLLDFLYLVHRDHKKW